MSLGAIQSRPALITSVRSRVALMGQLDGRAASLEARRLLGLGARALLPDLENAHPIVRNHPVARDPCTSPLPRLIWSWARGSAKMAQTIGQIESMQHARMKTLRRADFTLGYRSDTLRKPVKRPAVVWLKAKLFQNGIARLQHTCACVVCTVITLLHGSAAFGVKTLQSKANGCTRKRSLLPSYNTLTTPCCY